MADRVMYATNEDAPSGFSGFPFQVKQFADVIYNPVFYSIGLPLESADSMDSSCARWYGRVKGLAVTTDLKVTVSGTDYPFPASTWARADFPSTASRELDYFRNAGVVRGWQFAEIDPFWTSAGINLFGDSRILTSDWSTFYPFIAIAGQGASTIAQFSSSDPFDPDDPQSITGTIDGKPIPIYYTVQDDPDISISFSNFTATFVSYWPYAATNGTPIYDEATGLELQNPLN